MNTKTNINSHEENVFAIDKFSFVRPTPKTHVLEGFIARWQYVLYYVILGIVVCASFECEFNLDNLTNALHHVHSKGAILAIIGCVLNLFTPLFIVLMLDVMRKYNKLLQERYQISTKIITATMCLELVVGIISIIAEFDDISSLVIIAFVVCLTIMACQMHKIWTNTDEDLVAIGHTWFVYAIGTVALVVLYMVSGFFDNLYVSAILDILEVCLDLYLFIKMKDQIEDIGICFNVERNQYILEHPTDFSEEQCQIAEEWYKEVQKFYQQQEIESEEE